MHPPKRKEYQKQIYIRDDIYELSFVKGFEDKTQVGECDPSENTVKIITKLSPHDRYLTWWHESLHAMDFTWELNLDHDVIYKLEKPLADFYLKNFFVPWK